MIAIDKILPHDPPMVFLDQLVDYQDKSIQARVTIQTTSPFCENGSVPSYVAIEYMAQAIASWNGYRSYLENKPSEIGFLLGSRRLNLFVPYFRIGETLEVYGKCLYNDGEIASFECWIENNKIHVADGILNVYQPKDITQFNKNEK